MKIKFLFIILAFLAISCSSKNSTQGQEASTPSSRLDNLESRSNNTFKEMD